MNPTPADRPAFRPEPPDLLAGRGIALGVSGSIAAYKALALTSGLVQAGARVDVILTQAATELLRPLAFQALTHRPVVGDLWAPGSELAMDHLAIAQRAELLLVAPATADRLSRLALGLAGDALDTTALASTAPLVLAPAMEPNMWAHPAIQAHVASLTARGAHFVGPWEGRLASGKLGLGRMAEPETILDHLRWLLARQGDLAGRSILITAGPTREPLDPLRFLSNRSTGSMGFALARVARDRGARVTLIHGPVAQDAPVGVATVPVERALDMQAAVLDLAPACDALIMSAAVADYRPAAPSERKIKKQPGDLRLELSRNPDILGSLAEALAEGSGPPPYRVGFAAETEDLETNGRAKLQRKGLDLVVANRVPASFGAGEHEVLLLTPDASEALQGASKLAVAAAILDRVTQALGASPGTGTDVSVPRSERA